MARKQQQQQHLEAPEEGNVLPVFPRELWVAIASFLPSSCIALELRRASKAFAALFADPSFCTIHLSYGAIPHDVFASKWAAPDAAKSLTLQERRHLLCLTAASGSLANLEVAAHAACCTLNAAVAAAAAGGGHLHVLQWLQQQGCSLADATVLKAAAASGSLPVCEYLLAAKCRPTSWVVRAAAAAGHLHAVRWLLGRGCPWCGDAVNAAASGGHVAVLDELLRLHHEDPHRRPIDGVQLLHAAAAGCDLPTLRRLYDTYSPAFGRLLHAAPVPHMLACVMADPGPGWRPKLAYLMGECGLEADPRVTAGSLNAVRCADAVERLEALRQLGFTMDSGTLAEAAAARNAPAVAWLLHHHRDEWADSGAMVAAAAAGCMELMLSMHQQGCGANAADVVHTAAGVGNLGILAWAVQELGHEGLLSASVCRAAVESGRVDVVAWLAERPRAWGLFSPDVFAWAAHAGCEALLEWMAAKGFPRGNDCKPFEEAAAQGDLATLRALRRLRVPWGREAEGLVAYCIHLDSVGGRGSALPVIRCLVEELRCPMGHRGWGIAEVAARVSTDPRVADWVLHHKQREAEARSRRARRRDRWMAAGLGALLGVLAWGWGSGVKACC